MSLLDQLSSLCVPTINNFNSSLYSMGEIDIKVPSQQAKWQYYSQKYGRSNVIENKQKNQSIPKTSQKKMIKLFDDAEMNNCFRKIKSLKKSLAKQQSTQFIDKSSKQQQLNNTNTINSYVCSSFQENVQSQKLSQAQFKQVLLTRLTKMSYFINNKYRKLNYQFFVRLQGYTKKLIEEEKIKQKQIKQRKENSIQKGVQKLKETLDIINLKYFQFNEQNYNYNISIIQKDGIQIYHKQQIVDAFNSIRFNYKLHKSLEVISRICTKKMYRNFFRILQVRKKQMIKIQLFVEVIKGFILKKKRVFVRQLLGQVSHQIEIALNKQVLNTNFLVNQNVQQNIDNYMFQNNENIRYSGDINCQDQGHQILSTKIQLKPAASLLFKQNQYFKSKQQKLKITSVFAFQEPFNFKIQQIPYSTQFLPQNIPKIIKHLRNHDQQLNLNDCIDNGHLLMNQIKTNKSFREELQNLTISKINTYSNPNNSSLSSSVINGYENFILPQFNCWNQQKNQPPNKLKEKCQEPNSYTMRKTVRHQPSIKEIKKPRSSLVITKKKSSSIANIQFQQKFTSQKHQLSKKSSTTSKSKALNQIMGNQSLRSDPKTEKQIIKKMLQQLNKKYSFQNKTIQIHISNTKKNVNEKYNKKDWKEDKSSGKKNIQKVQQKNKKCKSQYFSEKFVVCQRFKIQDQALYKNLNQNKQNQLNYKIQLSSRDKKQLIKEVNCKVEKMGQYKESKKYVSQKDRNKTSRQDQKSNQYKHKAKKNSFMSITLLDKDSNGKKSGNVDKKARKISIQKVMKGCEDFKEEKETQMCQKRNINEEDHMNKKIKKQEETKIKEKLYRKNQFINLNQAESGLTCPNASARKQNHQNQSSVIIDLNQNKNINSSKIYNPKNFSHINLSSSNDSTINQFINYLPSNSQIPLSNSCINYQNQQIEKDLIDKYASYKPSKYSQIPNLSALDNSSQQQSYYTGQKGYQNTLNSSKSYIHKSIQKKRQSFQKSREQWEIMFDKMKNQISNSKQKENSKPRQSNYVIDGKKNSSNTKICTKIQLFDKYASSQNSQKRKQKQKASLKLNQSIIEEIKTKIEKCITCNNIQRQSFLS